MRGFTLAQPCATSRTLASRTLTSIPGVMRELYQAENPDGDNVNLSGLDFASHLSEWDAEALQLSYLYADFSVMQWDYDPKAVNISSRRITPLPMAALASRLHTTGWMVHLSPSIILSFYLPATSNMVRRCTISISEKATHNSAGRSFSGDGKLLYGKS